MHGLTFRHASLLCLAVSVCLTADCLSVERGHRSENQEGGMANGHRDGKNARDDLYRFTDDEEREWTGDEEEDLVVEDEDEEEDDGRKGTDGVNDEQPCGVSGLRQAKKQVLGVIFDRRRTMNEMILSFSLTKKNANKARQDLLLFVNSMHALIKKAYRDSLEEIDNLELIEAKRLDKLIPLMEEEVKDLELLNRMYETLIETRSNHDDPKYSPMLCNGLDVLDWSSFSVHADPMGGAIVRATSQVADMLDVMFESAIDTELDRIQECAVNVTLDLRTAHPSLVVSGDGKRASPGLTPTPRRHRGDDPGRFDAAPCVLANRGFRSGRFYYEVLVRNKTFWALGVARESVNRKGGIALSPKDGFWTVWLRDGEYRALAGPSVRFSLSPPPQKVGVFVDYEGGQVSFYDVDNRSLIYFYGGHHFTEMVYPVFCTGLNENGENAAPLVITPVSQTH